MSSSNVFKRLYEISCSGLNNAFCNNRQFYTALHIGWDSRLALEDGVIMETNMVAGRPP